MCIRDSAYLLGANDLITPLMVDEVVDIMGTDYPEIVENHDFIRGVVEREEESFRRTLKQGSVMLDEALDNVGKGQKLAGSTAFALHDTFGFPVEVTAEIAAERGVEIDTESFDAEMAAQQERGRADHAAKTSAGDDVSVFVALVDEHGDTEFVGRESYEIEASVLAVTDVGVVLDRTPFYAESGGQIGDTGTLVGSGGSVEILSLIHI